MKGKIIDITQIIDITIVNLVLIDIDTHRLSLVLNKENGYIHCEITHLLFIFTHTYTVEKHTQHTQLLSIESEAETHTTHARTVNTHTHTELK